MWPQISHKLVWPNLKLEGCHSTDSLQVPIWPWSYSSPSSNRPSPRSNADRTAFKRATSILSPFMKCDDLLETKNWDEPSSAASLAAGSLKLLPPSKCDGCDRCLFSLLVSVGFYEGIHGLMHKHTQNIRGGLWNFAPSGEVRRRVCLKPREELPSCL